MKSLLTLILMLFATVSFATGPAPTATQSATVSTTATGEMRSYGFGGTGLTSTAPCLESTSVLFGLVATTHVSKGCVARLYAAQCKDEKCRKAMTCLDPDLIDDAKVALGCAVPFK